MYCPNCGKELPGGSKFCPACGKATAPAEPPPPAKSAPTVTLNTKTLLIIAGAVIVLLLAVVIFRPGQSKAPDTPPAPGETSQVQQQDPEPDPAAALVGTWTNKDGVGLKFTKDGTLKLSGFGLSLGGDTFSYEVTGENEVTLTAQAGGLLSADFECPYILSGNTLYIQIGDYDFELTKG